MFLKDIQFVLGRKRMWMPAIRVARCEGHISHTPNAPNAQSTKYIIQEFAAFYITRKYACSAQMCFFCIAHICTILKRNLHKCNMVGGTFYCIVFSTKNLYKVQFERGACLCSGFICIALCSKMCNMQGGHA